MVHARGRASITLPDLAQDAAPFDVVVLPSGSWVQVAGPSVTVVAGRFVAPAQPDGVTIRFQAASGSTSFTVNVSAHTVWMMHAGALVPVFVSAGSTPVPTV